MNAVRIAPFALATALALLAGCTTSAGRTAPKVPASLKAPADQALSFEAYATGVQVYECRPAAGDPLRAEWVFKAPEADLFSRAGTRVGKHYAGPTWESDDGSKVVGEIAARDDGPDGTAIPWLLLRATTTSGAGVLGATASIQRVQTTGGKAPAAGCSQAQAGREIRVPYQAVYYFYASNR